MATDNHLTDSCLTGNRSTDNRSTDNCVTDNHLTDNCVTDSSSTDNHLTDNHLTNNCLTDNCLTDNCLTDNCLTDNCLTDNWNYVWKFLMMMIFMLALNMEITENKIHTFQKNTLHIALDTGQINYFLQNGYPAGYQLEMFEMFAQNENLNCEFFLVPDSLKFLKLNDEEIDIVVFNGNHDSLKTMVFAKYPNISSGLPFDDSLKFVWLTLNKNLNLQTSLSIWTENFRQQRQFKELRIRYFNNKYHRHDRLSPYDGLLKKYSAKIGWDWRLIAAIVYHESKFQSEVVSPNGATGLMQLMEVTAEYFGVTDIYDPEDNIMGGTKLLAFLANIFMQKGVSQDDIVNFVLASYNAGHGSIEHCMKIAGNLGLDPTKWENIYSVISLIHSEKIAAGVRLNGHETLRFINNVQKFYKHYQNFFERE